MEEILEVALKWVKANGVLAGWLVLGLIFSLGGGWWIWSESNQPEVELIEAEAGGVMTEIWVDVQGAVVQPGVYSLREGDRVKDALIVAGGLASDADREVVARYINLAEKVKDGSKLYIPVIGDNESGNEEKGEVKGLSMGNQVNVNTASVSELDQLWGVGEARAQTIIEGRPYQTTEEVKKVLPDNVYEQIKDKITVY